MEDVAGTGFRIAQVRPRGDNETMKHIGYSGMGILLCKSVMSRAGLDPARELGRFGIDTERLDLSLTGFSPMLEHQLCEHMSHTLRDDAFSLHLGQRVQEADFRLIWFFVSSQTTVRDAFAQFFTLMRSINDGQWSLVDTPPVCRLEVRPYLPSAWTPRMAEMRLSVVAWAVSRLAGQPIRPVAVHHTHPAPGTASEFERIYGAPVRFGQPVDAILYESRAMNLPSLGANPLLAQSIGATIRSLATPPPGFGWAGQVQDVLARSMAEGMVTLEAAARTLRVPPRTLTYLLAREGTTFRDVLDNLRRDIAMVQAGMPGVTTEHLAALLGYRDVRNFFRSFRRWTGTTPSHFRVAALAGPEPSA